MDTGIYDEEENAAHLQFGDEFFTNKIQSFSNDEIFCLLQQSTGKQDTEALEQTRSYIEKVVTTKNVNDCRLLAVEIRKQLEGLQLRKKGYYSTTLDDSESRAGLHHFELASLCNLIQDSEFEIEEVLSWIPSLSRFEDADIATAITIVKEAKERISAI